MTEVVNEAFEVSRCSFSMSEHLFSNGPVTIDDSFLYHRQHFFEYQLIFSQAEAPLLHSLILLHR